MIGYVESFIERRIWGSNQPESTDNQTEVEQIPSNLRSPEVNQLFFEILKTYLSAVDLFHIIDTIEVSFPLREVFKELKNVLPHDGNIEQHRKILSQYISEPGRRDKLIEIYGEIGSKTGLNIDGAQAVENILNDLSNPAVVNSGPNAIGSNEPIDYSKLKSACINLQITQIEIIANMLTQSIYGMEKLYVKLVQQENAFAEQNGYIILRNPYGGPGSTQLIRMQPDNIYQENSGATITVSGRTPSTDQQNTPGLPTGQVPYNDMGTGSFNPYAGVNDNFLPSRTYNSPGATFNLNVPNQPGAYVLNTPVTRIGVTNVAVNPSSTLPPKITTPSWVKPGSDEGGSGGDTIAAAIAFIAAITIDLFRKSAEKKFNEQCDASKKHTGDDCAKVGGTYDAYIERYYAMKSSGVFDPHLWVQFNVLSNDDTNGIPHFKGKAQARHDNKHLSDDSYDKVVTFYTNIFNKTNNNWMPTIDALSYHLNENLDQLLGAIGREKNEFVKGELIDIYVFRRNVELNALIAENKFQDAYDTLDRHSTIPLTNLENNYFGGIIQIGLGNFSQAIPSLINAANDGECSPELRNSLNDIGTDVREKMEIANTIEQHQNDSYEDWKNIIDLAAPEIKERLLEHIKDKICKEVLNFYGQYEQLNKDGKSTDASAALKNAEALIFDNGFELDPFIVNAIGGIVEFNLGNYGKAVELLKIAHKDENSKNDPMVLYALCLSLEQTEDIAGARVIAEEGKKLAEENNDNTEQEPRSIQNDPSVWQARLDDIDTNEKISILNKKLIEYLNDKDYQGGLECSQQLLDLKEDEPAFRASKAICLNGLNRHDEAAKLLQDDYNNDPERNDDPIDTNLLDPNDKTLPSNSDMYKQSTFLQTETELKLANCIYKSLVAPFVKRCTYSDHSNNSQIIAKALSALNTFEPDLIPAASIRLLSAGGSTLDINNIWAAGLSKYNQLLIPELSIKYVQNILTIMMNVSSGTSQLVSENWKKVNLGLLCTTTGLRVAKFAISTFEFFTYSYLLFKGKKINTKQMVGAGAGVVEGVASAWYEIKMWFKKERGELPENLEHYFIKDFLLMIPQTIKAYCDFSSEGNFDKIASVATIVQPIINDLVGNNQQEAYNGISNNWTVRQRLEQARLARGV